MRSAVALSDHDSAVTLVRDVDRTARDSSSAVDLLPVLLVMNRYDGWDMAWLAPGVSFNQRPTLTCRVELHLPVNLGGGRRDIVVVNSVRGHSPILLTASELD